MSVADAFPGRPAGEVPPHGSLEELDGTPIRSPASARPRPVSWPRAALAAAGRTAGRPRLWVYALLAFLARGGLLLLAIPIVVPPTFIGLANFVGPASVSAEGATPRLVVLLVAGTAAAAALAIVGTLVGAAAETALHRHTVAPGPDTGDARAVADDLLALERPAIGGRRAVARVAAVRLVLLVPVAAAVAAAIPAWVAVAYRELTLPTDVAAPLLIRILAGAPAASVGVLVAWLAGEVVGGFATRRAVLLDAPVPRALAGGALDPLRAPLGTFLTVGTALAISVAALLPAAWAIGAAWEVARRVLGAEAAAPAALGAALLLAAAWLAAMVVAGITAAWRSSLATAELLRRRPTRAEDPGAAGRNPAGPRHALAGRSVG